MLPIKTILANPGFPLNLANHVFDANDKGELIHLVEGDLRATVPPEGWDDYVKYWPAAIDVVRQLRAKHLADQATAKQSIAQRIAAAIPAGTDPKVTAAILGAMGAAAEELPAAAGPLADPQVQAAIAVLKAKGIAVTGG
jgi:hypothetical protein